MAPFVDADFNFRLLISAACKVGDDRNIRYSRDRVSFVSTKAVDSARNSGTQFTINTFYSAGVVNDTSIPATARDLFPRRIRRCGVARSLLRIVRRFLF